MGIPWVLALTAALAARAHAQDASPLAASLAARYPQRELVPQSCVGDEIGHDGRVCVRDAGGLVRAVRRVQLGDGGVRAVRRDREIVFSVADWDTTTRFAHRAWRWDLGADTFRSLGELGQNELESVDGPSTFVALTSFGLLYRIRAGVMLDDGARARPVIAPEWIGIADPFVLDGVTYGVTPDFEEDGDPIAVVRRLELAGNAVRAHTVATLPGEISLHGRVIVTREDPGEAIALHVVALPGARVVDVTMPFDPTSVTLRDDGRAVRVRGARRAIDVDVATGAITAVDPATIPSAVSPPAPLVARSLHQVVAAQSGVWLQGSASRGFLLDASGATPRRRAPRASTACRCRGEDAVCRSGPTIAGACAASGGPAVVRLEGELDGTPPAPETPVLTGDGRFRVDRLEADYVRITRLADGARLWVRLLDDAILAQLDDGTYFVSDRSLESRIALREGPSLLDAPIVPLSSRADALYRPTLIAELFAAPAATP